MRESEFDSKRCFCIFLLQVLIIVIHLSWFPIQTYDHVFTDTLLEFDRVFDTSENRSVLENMDLLSLIEKRSVFSNTDLFLFKR